jgi:hypothetical protein
MSALKSALKAVPDILGDLVTAGRNVLKRTPTPGENVVKAGDSLAAKGVKADKAAFKASVVDAGNIGDNVVAGKAGKAPANTMPPPSASATSRAAAKDSTLAKYGITPTKVFAGISATVMASLALARLDNTDGVKVAITDIKILSADKVQIMYTPAGSNFSPCVNDTFTFYPPPNPDATPTTPDLSIGGDKTVVQVIDGHTIVIQAALTRAGNSVYPSPAPAPAPAPDSNSPAPAPAPAISWGKMTCHSDYDNQLGQVLGEAVAFVAGTAAAATVETIGALTPAMSEVLGAAAGGAATVLAGAANALTPLANDLFGPIKEFFDKFKWIIIAICVILCGGLAAALVLS